VTCNDGAAGWTNTQAAPVPFVERTTRNRGVAVARQRDRAALFGLTDSAVPHGGLAPVVGAAHEVAGLLARNLVNSSYREEEEQKAIVEARSALTTGRFTLAERGRVSDTAGRRKPDGPASIERH
jgi:hypothetical protein